MRIVLPERRRTDENVISDPFRRCISEFKRVPEGRRTDENVISDPFRRCISEFQHASGS